MELQVGDAAQVPEGSIAEGAQRKIIPCKIQHDGGQTVMVSQAGQLSGSAVVHMGQRGGAEGDGPSFCDAKTPCRHSKGVVVAELGLVAVAGDSGWPLIMVVGGLGVRGAYGGSIVCMIPRCRLLALTCTRVH